MDLDHYAPQMYELFTNESKGEYAPQWNSDCMAILTAREQQNRDTTPQGR